MLKEILSIRELEIYADMPKNTIYSLTSQKLIPHYKRGRRVYFRRSEIDEWLNQSKIEVRHNNAADIEEKVQDYILDNEKTFSHHK